MAKIFNWKFQNISNVRVKIEQKELISLINFTKKKRNLMSDR